MRKIAFRAWDKHENKFIDGWYLDYRGEVYNNGRDLEDNIPQLDLELLQFTGLKDKNGKEIYEGDILRDLHGQVYEVAWWSDGMWMPKHNGSFLGYSLGALLEDGSLGPFEVIGNVWENPELINSHE